MQHARYSSRKIGAVNVFYREAGPDNGPLVLLLHGFPTASHMFRDVIPALAPGDDDTQVEHWLWHQFIERYIEWSGFSFTHLRPEIFMQNLLGYGGAKVVVAGVIRHFVAGARITWVDGEDVAAIAAAALCAPEEHADRTYRIGSEVKSFAEIAGILTRVVGQPFSYEPRPPDEFLEVVLAANADASYMRSVFENYSAYTAGTNVGEEKTFDSFSRVTGRQPVLWEEFAQRHRESFAY